MRKMRYRRKKTSRISIIIFIVIVGIFCSYRVIKKFSDKVNEGLLDYASIEITNLMTIVINKSINEEVLDFISDSSLFNVVYDNDGNIKMIDFDATSTNKVLKRITSVVTHNLKLIEEGKIEEIDYMDMGYLYNLDKLSNGIVCEVPMGSFTGNNFLANLGPMIPVRLKIMGDATSNLKTKVSEYGINNALIELSVSIEVKGVTVLPFTSRRITVNSSVPLSMKVIQGNIPSYYLDGIRNNSNLFGVLDGG